VKQLNTHCLLQHVHWRLWEMLTIMFSPVQIITDYKTTLAIT